MANYLYGSTFATPSAYVAYSTQTGWSASAVGDILHPNRVWRSGASISTSDYVGIDLGAATTVTAVIVDNINIPSITIQSAADSGFSSSLTNEVTGATVSQDPTDGRYKYFLLINSGTGRARQYWRILSASSTTYDGGPAMRVGSFALITESSGGRTITTNPGYPFGRSSQQAINATVLPGGGREVAKFGERYAMLNFSQATLGNTSSNEADFFRIAGSIGEHQPMFVYLNQSDTSRVYICRRVGIPTLNQAGPNHYAYNDLSLEEVC